MLQIVLGQIYNLQIGQVRPQLLTYVHTATLL